MQDGVGHAIVGTDSKTNGIQFEFCYCREGRCSGVVLSMRTTNARVVGSNLACLTVKMQ